MFTKFPVHVKRGCFHAFIYKQTAFKVHLLSEALRDSTVFFIKERKLNSKGKNIENSHIKAVINVLNTL